MLNQGSGSCQSPELDPSAGAAAALVRSPLVGVPPILARMERRAFSRNWRSSSSRLSSSSEPCKNMVFSFSLRWFYSFTLQLFRFSRLFSSSQPYKNMVFLLHWFYTILLILQLFQAVFLIRTLQKTHFSSFFAEKMLPIYPNFADPPTLPGCFPHQNPTKTWCFFFFTKEILLIYPNFADPPSEHKKNMTAVFSLLPH